MSKPTSVVRVALLAFLVGGILDARGAVTPSANVFEIDGDYGSVIDTNGDVLEDGLNSTFSWQGSGKLWEHWTETAFEGLNSYKVRCVGSPGAANDRSEQKMLWSWSMADRVRYFSRALYVPASAPTPTDFFQFFCQWWQIPTRQPAVQLSWGGDDHIWLARRTEATGWDGLYDAGPVLRNHWHHFLFAIEMGLADTGRIIMYRMDQATGAWVELYRNEAVTLGWATNPDGSPADTGNFQWKVGTYRGSTPLTTRIYYDNIRYGRLWSLMTSNYLTGYHQNVMFLPFDEASGSITQDQSAYYNDGTLMHGTTRRSGGISGNCLEFDGVEDHVRVAVDPEEFDFGNYMTASGWFKTTHDQVGTTILCMDEYSTTYKFRLYFVSGTRVSFDIRHPDDTKHYVTADLPSSVFDGAWHHMAGTYNRWAPDGQRLKLYVDGQLVATHPGEDKPLWRGNNYLYVGKFSGEYFHGFIDEPAVYNYAMSDAQVAALYSQHVSTDVQTPTAPDGRLALRSAPNPFNPSTTISFVLPSSGNIRLDVYSMDGRRRSTLIEGELAAGRHEIVWDGRDESGRTLPSGVYVSRLEAGGVSETTKLILVK